MTHQRGTECRADESSRRKPAYTAPSLRSCCCWCCRCRSSRRRRVSVCICGASRAGCAPTLLRTAARSHLPLAPFCTCMRAFDAPRHAPRLGTSTCEWRGRSTRRPCDARSTPPRAGLRKTRVAACAHTEKLTGALLVSAQQTQLRSSVTRPWRAAADTAHLLRTVHVADSAAGLCAPHPKSGEALACRTARAVLTSTGGSSWPPCVHRQDVYS